MGKVLFGLLLTTAISLGAQTPLNVINSRCSDATYAYNQMDVTERGDSLYLSLSGSTVFNLLTVPSDSFLTTKSFKIKKSDCEFIDNKRNIFCDSSASEVDVTVHTRYPESLSVVKVKMLSLAVWHFSSANHHPFVGLSIRYKLGDTGKYMTNKTLFPSCRSL